MGFDGLRGLVVCGSGWSDSMGMGMGMSWVGDELGMSWG